MKRIPSIILDFRLLKGRATDHFDHKKKVGYLVNYIYLFPNKFPEICEDSIIFFSANSSLDKFASFLYFPSQLQKNIYNTFRLQRGLRMGIPK